MARLRRKASRGRPDLKSWPHRQREWVRRNAAGKSFADIGGLYLRDGDIAFTAEDAGATEVTCFDGGDPDLCGFAEAHAERGSRVRFVQGDLDERESVRRVGPHDIVWCTGVIYHTPHPVNQLMNLRGITRELLYLGALTIPEVPGFPQACIYLPYLDERQRAPYAAGYDWAKTPGGHGSGIRAPFDETPMRGHANNWWGIAPSALRAMLATARFEVVEEIRTHQFPYVTEIVARPRPVDPFLPPVDYFRERGERRERGEERGVFLDYYEEQRKPAAEVSDRDER